MRSVEEGCVAINRWCAVNSCPRIISKPWAMNALPRCSRNSPKEKDDSWKSSSEVHPILRSSKEKTRTQDCCCGGLLGSSGIRHPFLLAHRSKVRATFMHPAFCPSPPYRYLGKGSGQRERCRGGELYFVWGTGIYKLLPTSELSCLHFGNSLSENLLLLVRGL